MINNVPGPELTDRYLDGCLNGEDMTRLQDWIQAAPENARWFAERVLLHDQLWNGSRASPSGTEQVTKPGRNLLGNGWLPALLATAASFLLVCTQFWMISSDSPTSASVREFDRVAQQNKSYAGDRTFRLDVESTQDGSYGNLGMDTSDESMLDKPDHSLRPPKISLDGALLHVRSENQFVLIRSVASGGRFITGSDGSSGWMIDGNGPVRISSDPERYNHDLPGNELSLPLTTVLASLARLQSYYNIELSPTPTASNKIEEDGYAEFIAIKKSRQRGPRVIKILYESQSGFVKGITFIGMHHGRERINVKLSLISETKFSADFFDHRTHHEPERPIEFE